jgi:hypothetical protein
LFEGIYDKLLFEISEAFYPALIDERGSLFAKYGDLREAFGGRCLDFKSVSYIATFKRF